MTAAQTSTLSPGAAALADLMPQVVPPVDPAAIPHWRVVPHPRPDTPPLTADERLLLRHLASGTGLTAMRELIAGGGVRLSDADRAQRDLARVELLDRLFALAVHPDEQIALAALQAIEGRDKPRLWTEVLPVWLARAAQQGEVWTPVLEALGRSGWDARRPWPRHDAYQSVRASGWVAGAAPGDRGASRGLDPQFPVALDEHVDPWIRQIATTGDRARCQTVVQHTSVRHLHRQMAAELPVADLMSLSSVRWWMGTSTDTATGLAANPQLPTPLRQTWLAELLIQRFGPVTEAWRTTGSEYKAASEEVQSRLVGWLSQTLPPPAASWNPGMAASLTSASAADEERAAVMACLDTRQLHLVMQALMEATARGEQERVRGYRSGSGEDYTVTSARSRLLRDAVLRPDLDADTLTRLLDARGLPEDVVSLALQHPAMDPTVRDAYLARQLGEARDRLVRSLLSVGRQSGQWCPWAWVAPQGGERPTEERLQALLLHPELTESVILDALGRDTRDLRQALATSPVASRHPRVRDTLLRSTSAPIQYGLLLGATDPAEYASLFYRVLQNQPKEALTLLADTPPPAGTEIPVGWIKSYLTSAESEWRQLAVRALPRCVGGTEALQVPTRAPALRRKRGT